MSKTSQTPVRPLQDRILVETQAREEKTAGGLYIPQTAQTEKLNRGKVVATGPGRRSDSGEVRALDTKVGDTVLFSAYSGTKLELEGGEFTMLREDDVIGILN